MKVLDLVRDNIKNLKAYSSARDEFKEVSDAMVFIDANENPFGNQLNRYPDPYQLKVKEQLSLIKKVPVEKMLLGNGSDEVLDLIFRVFCEPNKDNVIIMPPTYGMYEVLANINAIELLKVELNTDFQPQVDKILTAKNINSKIVFICSPNNPTANSITAESIERLLKGFPGIVVVDEAYIDFAQEESWLNRLDEFPNLIVIQTLSKAYGLAAIRMGICYASKEIITILNRIKPPYNVNYLTQQKALEELKSIATIESNVERILQEKIKLKQALTTIEWIETVFHSDSNFFLIKVDDANKRYNQLLANGIVVRNRTNEALCTNCLRITVGTPEENYKLIEILKIV